MALEIKVTQTDIRGFGADALTHVQDDMNNWLMYEADAAPVSASDIIVENTTANNSMFLSFAVTKVIGG